jgi:cytidylate kinase
MGVTKQKFKGGGNGMENLLVKYFQLRMEKENSPVYHEREPGPVITISREVGCPGKTIAGMLVEKIAESGVTGWKWVDKEILEQIALELHLTPSIMEDISKYEDRRLTDYIALLLSRDYYPGEKRIKNKWSEIINNLAGAGQVIIVGRAGFYITGYIPKSYHVRLYAPEEWRIDYIAEKKGCSFQDSMKLVEEMSRKRKQFLGYFESERKVGTNFNREFDCSVMTHEEIVNQMFADIRSIDLI